MNSTEIRQRFLDFFQSRHHAVVQSSSLIPAEDPTLLFTNAGMNQFKDCFLGKEQRSYKRATSIQKCVRAGGKHNDLDQVGFTERHLTFFEMMGNFSFGDYFKKDAIRFAWDLLTQVYKLSPEKLYVSVFQTDDEAYSIWLKEIGLTPDRIIRLGEKDNFWQMGDTGPCGPCTEIYIDQGVREGCRRKTCMPGCDCSRFTEIWNLVFMQYDRQNDGSLKPLVHTGVDTGMGFERLCMVMQGVKNVFHIDAMQSLIKHLEKSTGVDYQTSDTDTQAAFHVLADHIRSSSLLIADGCSPSNDGRGYVLRKIVRRAALFAQKLTKDNQLFPTLAEYFIKQMSPIYPELTKNQELIVSVLKNEIDRFAENLIHGQNILERYMDEHKKRGEAVLAGPYVFKLYDTYGFPLELTRLIAEKNNFSVDQHGFESEMKKQQEQSGKKTQNQSSDYEVPNTLHTTFVGYETFICESPIQYFIHQGNYAWLSTKESPFYVECGGQVNDQGWVTINGHSYKVLDLAKAGETFNPAIMVKISTTATDGIPLQGVKEGDIATSHVIPEARLNTMKNHTATHMLQAALIAVLGPQVKQAGSLVTDSYLRFDFSYHKPMTSEEINKVEKIINNKIQENISTSITYTTLEEAKKKGVISFFGEKYNPEQVRVVEIPGFSAELCGGTHAGSTGIIGAFKITSEIALSTGTRRITAVTGPEAIRLFQQCFDITKNLSVRFKAKNEDVLECVEKQYEQLQESIKSIKALKQQLIKAHLPGWTSHITTENNIPLLYLTVDRYTMDEMRYICQEIEKNYPGFYIIVNKSGTEDSFTFLAHLSAALTSRLNLKHFAEWLKKNYNLKSGGNEKIIQGGGTQIPSHFKQEIINWLKTIS